MTQETVEGSGVSVANGVPPGAAPELPMHRQPMPGVNHADFYVSSKSFYVFDHFIRFIGILLRSI